VDGFYGASSVERLPAERAIKAQIETFKAIKLPAGKSAARNNGAKKPGKAGVR